MPVPRPDRRRGSGHAVHFQRRLTPKRTMIPQVDAVIVGGGIVGGAAAYYLAGRGLRPLVLEQRAVAAQQSGRSFGFVRQQGRDPLELPLAIESNRLWRNFQDDLGADVGWVQGGILTLA